MSCNVCYRYRLATTPTLEYICQPGEYDYGNGAVILWYVKANTVATLLGGNKTVATVLSEPTQQTLKSSECGVMSCRVVL